MMKRCRIAVCIVVWICASQSSDASDGQFQKDVLPILQTHCVRCHNPGNAKGDVSVATLEGLADYIEAGDSENSYLVELVQGSDDEPPEMPKEGKPLSWGEVESIANWIDAGAHWPEEVVVREKPKADASWWSIQPLETDFEGAASIDDFVINKLDEAGLEQNAPADRRTLIRRATFDLIGLPPTPEEVEAFVNDPDPYAYEQLIDRLLASPHYGQRWGRHWLDVVRFGESNGFERNVIINDLWPFRDYVIRSINEDKPFDEFIREHLAGDVLGKNDPGREIGSAFLVAGPYDNVGNQDPVAAAQIRANTIDEMIRASGEAFLGLTMGCARCHDHKFDPISQEDYYGWYSTFAGVRHGSRTWATKEQIAGRDAKVKPLQKQRATLVARQNELNSAITKRLWDREWNRPAVSAKKNVETFEPVDAKFVRFSVQRSSTSQPCVDEIEIYSVGDDANVALAANGTKATASSLLPGYAIHQIEHINDGKAGNENSWISKESTGWVQLAFPSLKKIDRVVWGRDRDGRFRDRVPTEYTIEVSVDGKQWQRVVDGSDRKPFDEAQLLARWKQEGVSEIEQRWVRAAVDRRETEERFEPVRAKFVRLVCEAQDINPASSSGFRIDEMEVWTNGEKSQNVALQKHGGKATGRSREIKDFAGAYGAHLANDGKAGERFIATGNDLTIELSEPVSIDRMVFSSARGESTPEHRKFVFVADYRIEVSLDGKQWNEVANGRDRKPVNDAHRNHRIAKLTGSQSEEQQELERVGQQIAKADRQIAQANKLPTAWLGSRQKADGPFHVFLGGSPQKKGAEVTPKSLSAMATTAPVYSAGGGADEKDRRIELANWITDDNNPLTARVLANRIWQHHFGTGIVDTPNDLGYMGGRPTHPKLLDFLASELVRGGWRLKSMHRSIMLTKTYQQSSRWHEKAAKMDGDSRLLWRFPPRRLSAEEVRDSVLQVSGKLERSSGDGTVDGGPGFRLYEYQQDNVATYVPLDAHGPETYRRAVYHQNARASVIDLMTEFDQPDCAFSEPRRASTTTPLQALTLLNHRFTVDMAKAFADRLAAESQSDVSAQIDNAYQHCYGRHATKDELSLASDFVEKNSLAAFCRVLFNTSELIYVR